MPKLIIPNALDLNQPEDYQNTQEEAVARQFYNMRFLWLLDPGDLILLPKSPSTEFISYLAEVKQIDPNDLSIIEWENNFNAPTAMALKNPNLIKRMQKYISRSRLWSIQTCFFNQSILNLAHNLNIHIDQKWRDFALNNFCRYLNSKAEFRKLSENHDIPVPEGEICNTWQELSKAILGILPLTGQLIIKQEFNAGGRGNIGIAINSNLNFIGVTKIIYISTDQHIDVLSKKIWNTFINDINHQLIVEAYYPNTGTFTVIFCIPTLGHEPRLLNYSEIRMESTWVGVQTPAHALSKDQTKKLVTTAGKYAYLLQEQGYQGFICCDAIRTCDNQILFTEVNVRPGAETHAHVLATHLFGDDYYQHKTLLTRNGIKIESFDDIHRTLKKQGLLFNKQRQCGMVFLTVEDLYAKQGEYLVVGKDLSEACKIEKQVLDLF